jgi:hypothetical protein
MSKANLSKLILIFVTLTSALPALADRGRDCRHPEPRRDRHERRERRELPGRPRFERRR